MCTATRLPQQNISYKPPSFPPVRCDAGTLAPLSLLRRKATIPLASLGLAARSSSAVSGCRHTRLQEEIRDGGI